MRAMQTSACTRSGFVLLAITVIACRSGERGPLRSSGEDSTHLVLQYTVAVPDAFEVRGGTINDSRTVVVWSSTGTLRASPDGRLWNQLACASVRRTIPLAAAYDESLDRLEVFDSLSQQVIAEGSLGCNTVWSPDSGSPVKLAARIPTGWVLGRSNSDTVANLEHYSIRGTLLGQADLQKLPTSWLAASSFLTSTGTGVVLSSARRPFQWVVLDPNQAYWQISRDEIGEPRWSGDPDLGIEWLGLAVTQLPNRGFVQTLIDPMTGSRIMVSYTSERRVLRRVEGLPGWAIVGSSPNLKWILAVEHTDSLRLLVYHAQ